MPSPMLCNDCSGCMAMMALMLQTAMVTDRWPPPPLPPHDADDARLSESVWPQGDGCFEAVGGVGTCPMGPAIPEGSRPCCDGIWLPGCQAARLSGSQAVRLPGCQAVRLHAREGILECLFTGREGHGHGHVRVQLGTTASSGRGT